MKPIISVAFICLCLSAHSQELTENEKLSLNGLEFSYNITNTQEKDEYNRYEVTISCRNQSEGTIFKPPVVQSGTYIKYENRVATFNCTNATGKRLTPKSATLEMKDLTVPVSDTYTDCKTNKTVTQIIYVKAGSILQPGETISRKVIFLTPKGEKPKINLSLLL